MSEFTRENIIKAMQCRIESGVLFQAKNIVKAGLHAVIKDAPQHALYQHPKGYEYGGYFDGEPLSRMADKLLQKNRKAGKIKFHAGFWSYVGERHAP